MSASQLLPCLNKANTLTVITSNTKSNNKSRKTSINLTKMTLTENSDHYIIQVHSPLTPKEEFKLEFSDQHQLFLVTKTTRKNLMIPHNVDICCVSATFYQDIACIRLGKT